MKESNFLFLEKTLNRLFDEKEKDLWLWFWAFVGGVFFSAAYHFGRQLDTNGNVNFTSVSTWGWTLGTAVVLTLFLAFVFTLLSMYKKEPVSAECAGVSVYSKKRWLLGALGLFLCWPVKGTGRRCFFFCFWCFFSEPD